MSAAKLNVAAWWLGIVIAPSAFLSELGLAYALVPWACSSQHHGVIDAAAAVALLVTAGALAASAVAWLRARRDSPSPQAARQVFMSQLAVALSALSMLAVIAQWATRIAISPCSG